VIGASWTPTIVDPVLLERQVGDCLRLAEDGHHVARQIADRRAVVDVPRPRSGPADSRTTRRRRWRAIARAQKRRTHYTPPPDVDFALSDRQAEVFEAAARFRVLIAGRRFGKTYLAVVELIVAAAARPKSLCWYVAPSYRQAKDIAWDTLKELVPEALRAGDPNETTLTIRLVNGSIIQLKGADKPNTLRGRTLWFVVLDEFPLQRRAVWDEVIRPSLATTQGHALFIGTPLGFNWGYDFFLRGQADPKFPRWTSWQFTTAEGGLVSDEELAEASSSLDPRIYRQEYHASFETLSGRVFFGFDRRLNVDKAVTDPGDCLLIIGMDFNINPMTAVLMTRHVAKDGLVECHVHEAIELQTSSTEEMAQVLRERFPREVPDPKRPGMKRPGRRIVVCPDPAGGARHTSAPIGQTDHTILERAGFLVDAPKAAPLVKDRNNNTNAMLCAANNRRRVRVNPRAAALIKALDGLTYKEGTNVPDKKSGLDHVCDAFGYALWQQFNVLNPTAWGSSHFAV
jgi:hypothetical protein